MGLTFKDKENIIRRYGDEYKKSKLIETKGLELLQQDIVKEKEYTYINDVGKYQYYYGLQNKIDNILEKMDFEDANFIKKEFLVGNYKTNWWMNYFSRSTYYRIKKKTMEKFMELLYD